MKSFPNFNNNNNNCNNNIEGKKFSSMKNYINNNQNCLGNNNFPENQYNMINKNLNLNLKCFFFIENKS
jgi:hypothetical protein